MRTSVEFYTQAVISPMISLIHFINFYLSERDDDFPNAEYDVFNNDLFSYLTRVKNLKS